MKFLRVGTAFVILAFLITAFIVRYIDFSKQTFDLITAVSPTPTPSVHLSSDKLWQIVENWRESEDLPKHKNDPTLCLIAEKRLEEIKTDFSHDKFIERFTNNSYPIAENLARGMISEENTLIQWLHSASHAAALRASYEYSCIRAKDDRAVQIFAQF